MSWRRVLAYALAGSVLGAAVAWLALDTFRHLRL